MGACTYCNYKGEGVHKCSVDKDNDHCGACCNVLREELAVIEEDEKINGRALQYKGTRLEG